MKRPIYAKHRTLTSSGTKADAYLAVGTIDFDEALISAGTAKGIVCRIILSGNRLGELVVFQPGATTP